jgi:hypothetical protein
LSALKNSPRRAYSVLKSQILKRYYTQLDELRKSREEMERIRSATSQPGGFNVFGGELRTPKEIEQEGRVQAARRVQSQMIELKKTVGSGIFDSFLEYEIGQFNALVNNTLTAVRFSPLRSTSASDGDLDAAALSNGIITSTPNRLWRSDTVVGCLSNMFITGPSWLFKGTAPMQVRPENSDTWAGWTKMIAYRGLYIVSLLVLLLFSFAMLATAGGVICRMSALEIAGVERAPLKGVFLFVLKRLWVFIKLPIVPLLIVLVIGLGMTGLGLVGAIPFVGEILIGFLFIVFIAIGFVVMLLLLGILGGFHLLYPTLAVEGSDVFDAMSRAFAYVYARPWRLAWYTLVALAYGVLTLLFVCFAVYLVLAATHLFVGWGTSLFGYNLGWNSGSPKMETLWPAPRYGRLIAPINWWAMSWSEYVGAVALHFWVFMLISAIGAFVMSYYHTIHTLIYMLIRRSVDGQAIEEVYLENDPKPAASDLAAPAIAAALTTPPAPENPSV